MYFGLFPKFHSDPVLPSTDVKLYDKTVLNVGVLTDLIDFEEDQEITFIVIPICLTMRYWKPNVIRKRTH